MSYFSKFRHLYSEPERFDRYEASAVRRRVERELERVRAIEGRRTTLSPANQSHLKILQDFINEKSKAQIDVERAKARAIAAPSARNLRDHKTAISRLLNLAQRVERLREITVSQRGGLTSSEGSKRGSNQGRAKPSGGDRREFNFNSPTIRTIFGTAALINEIAHKPKFTTPNLVIPCIQRVVRREVMFATRKAGRGYRKPHRFGPSSLIGC